MGGFDKSDHKAGSGGKNIEPPAIYFEGYSVDSIRELRNFPGKPIPDRTSYLGKFAEFVEALWAKVQHEDDLKQYDRNGNGKLDDKEFKHAMENAPTVEELLRFDTLKLYDKNHDGLIVGKEADKRDEDAKKSQEQQLLKFDTNHDGKLDRDERKVQTADLLDKQKVLVSEKELKEITALSVHDLRANLELGDFSDIMRDMHRAQEKLPKVQHDKYLKAINDEFHKWNPNAEILEVSYFGKRYSLRIQSLKHPNVIYFFNPDQAHMAKDF